MNAGNLVAVGIARMPLLGGSITDKVNERALRVFG
jgi:hypothetical protein